MSAQWLSLGPLQDGRNLDEMTGGLPGVAAALVDCGGAALYLYQKERVAEIFELGISFISAFASSITVVLWELLDRWLMVRFRRLMTLLYAPLQLTHRYLPCSSR